MSTTPGGTTTRIAITLTGLAAFAAANVYLLYQGAF